MFSGLIGYLRKRQRLVVVFFLSLSTFICYIDRSNIGATIMEMQAEYDWNESQKGIILSSFFYGYLLTEIPGGIATSLYGPKVVLGAGVVGWSIATILTPMVAHNINLLLCVRFLMGLAEGVTFPSCIQFVANWFPEAERARANTIISSSTYIGIIVGLGVTPVITEKLSWHWAFYLFGSLGLIWYIPYHFLVTDSPSNHPYTTDEEKKLIQDQKSTTTHSHINFSLFKTFFTSKPMMAIITAHFCGAFGWYILMSWMPSYLSSLGLDKSDLGFSALPYLFGFLAANAAAYLSDYLFKNKVLSKVWIRKLMVTVGFVVPAIVTYFLGFVKSPVMAVAYLALSMSFYAFVSVGYSMNMIDIAPRYASQVMGLSNTIATLPGILGNTMTGFIVNGNEENGFGAVFSIVSGFYLFGWIVYMALAKSEVVFN